MFLLLEAGLWLLGIPDPGLYTGDPRTVWWLRPHLDRSQSFPPTQTAFRIQTNDLGLRGARPPDTGPWTLALGCSTTFGWGVEAEQAWPALLSSALGEPVVNGGIPGWSSHQARQGAARFLHGPHPPSRVILGYIVRDAQPAAWTDAESTPTPTLQRTHLFRLLSARLHPTTTTAAAAAAAPLPTVRVPPAAYRENLQAILDQLAPETEVWLLSFPQPDPHALDDWRTVLAGLGPPVLAPRLPASLFFDQDPIHLTAQGNAALADALAPRLTPPP